MHLTQSVVVFKILKHQLISFSTVGIIYPNERLTFPNIIRNIDRNILNKNDLKVMETLLYGNSSLDDTNNTLIMNATREFLLASKIFNVPNV